MRKRLKIAIIPGDGVGPELMDQCCLILDELNKKYGLKIEYNTLPYSSEYYLKNNIILPEDRMEEIKKDYHTMIMGPLGDSRIPDAIHARTMINNIRQYYNLNSAIQHVTYYHDNILPLKEIPEDDFDFYIFRENIEGFNLHFVKNSPKAQYLNISDDSNIYTRSNLEKFLNTSFKYAQRLNKKKIFLVLKKYYFPKTNKLWSNVFEKVSKNYPDIETRIISTEMAIYYLMNNPALFDILIAPDVFADQLMTLGTFLMGGFGMSFYFNYGTESLPVFRILHKPAHKYKDTGQINPIGTIRALQHMLDHFNMKKQAQVIDHSIRELFKANKATIDLGGLLGVQETVDHILDSIDKA